ncbi:DNA glycosylase AlkZ-like family protein [Nonomuraea longispora]|nr:crosslink repair DNA glycosylase YcaQ family protein [Nonomuraea longispora]
MLQHLGAIQLDAIQRVDRAHRLVCFARDYSLSGRDAIDVSLWTSDGEALVFESWAHAVCILPVDDWPLWHFLRDRLRKASWAPSQEASQRIVQLLTDDGPQTLKELEAGTEKSSGWDWSETKRAAEFLVWTGSIVCCERRGTKRVYDAPERRIPEQLLRQEPDVAESLMQLIDRAARVYGIATAGDLADYFRLSRLEIEPLLPDLGLVSARVDGWGERAWVHPSVLNGSLQSVSPTFVSPFDNLIWDRDRVRRVFDFDYTFEAYKPVAKRRFGYYVMPLVVADALVGRADLVREKSRLVAKAVYFEDAKTADVDTALEAGQRLAMQLGGLEFQIDDVLSTDI